VLFPAAPTDETHYFLLKKTTNSLTNSATTTSHTTVGMSFAELITQVVGGFLVETDPTAALDPKIEATLYYSDKADTHLTTWVPGLTRLLAFDRKAG